MISCDTNILVACHRQDYGTHKQILKQLAAVLNKGTSVGILWPCVQEFLAVVTNPRVFKRLSSLSLAFEFMERLLQQKGVTCLYEKPGHMRTLREISLSPNTVSGKIHDARIAAICLTNQVEELWTAKRDFSSFPRLKTFNPLTG
ncbi:MAG: TA system VapC family ribonuclease toxin [Opitutales bacterium]